LDVSIPVFKLTLTSPSRIHVLYDVGNMNKLAVNNLYCISSQLKSTHQIFSTKLTEILYEL